MSKCGKLCALAPEEMSVHMLIGDIARHTGKALSDESDSLGIAIGYRAILFNLGINDGITQLELSRLTGLKPPTVSVSLQKMEAEGLVTRIDDKDDLRKTIVSLTDKGRDLCQKVGSVLIECETVVTEALDTDELETLKSLLLKIRKNISESEEG